MSRKLNAKDMSVALQNADCTTVGRKFDFREALANSAEEALGKFGRDVFHAMGIGMKIVFRAIIDRAHGSLRVQVERITAREPNFHQALSTLHGVEASADKVAVKKNIAGGGEKIQAG